METTEAFTGLSCTGCGARFEADEPGRCPDCDAPLDPTYDYDAVDDFSPGDTMWSFEALLPTTRSSAVSIDEGGTPLVEAPSLADELGVARVVLKDEGRNPTGTLHDRGMALAVTAARARGVEPLAHASAGNSGQSAAAYAGRAGLRSYAFVPARSTFGNKAMVNVHGGEMRVVGGRYPAAVAARADLETEWHSLQEFTSPYRHEGAKTVGLELGSQLAFEAPDAVFVPCATGEVVVGVEKGLRELVELDLLGAVPPVYAVQPAGCSPVVAAWQRATDGGDASVEPWRHPDTICGELEIPDPAGGGLAVEAVERSGGRALGVGDADLLESAVVATEHVGCEVSAAGGAAVAGAWTVADDLSADATVAVVNPASGSKDADVLRSHLMGQGV